MVIILDNKILWIGIVYLTTDERDNGSDIIRGNDTIIKIHALLSFQIQNRS
jgi:hypothetical protein